jgi:hypothetical protein
MKIAGMTKHRSRFAGTCAVVLVEAMYVLRVLQY